MLTLTNTSQLGRVLTPLEAAISAFVYGAGAGDGLCRKDITTAEIAAFLKKNAPPNKYWETISALEATGCPLGDDCTKWDALELAKGALDFTRPASCQRSATHLAALAKGGGAGGGALCHVPPFAAVRCWWPYALGGAAVGGLVVALIKRRREQDRRRQ